MNHPELFGGNLNGTKDRDIFSDFPQTQLSGKNFKTITTCNDKGISANQTG